MEKKIFNTIVNRDCHQNRLDKFLHSQVKSISRTKLQDLIIDGCVRLNNTIIYDTSKKVKENDSIKVNFPPPKETLIRSNKIPLNILYDVQDIIIIN